MKHKFKPSIGSNRARKAGPSGGGGRGGRKPSDSLADNEDQQQGLLACSVLRVCVCVMCVAPLELDMLVGKILEVFTYIVVCSCRRFVVTT